MPRPGLRAVIIAVAFAVSLTASRAPAAVPRPAIGAPFVRTTAYPLMASSHQVRLRMADLDVLTRTVAHRIALPFVEGRSLTLDLQRFNVFTPDARITYTDARGPHPLPLQMTFFKGAIEGSPGSWVVVSVTGSTVRGSLELEGRRYTLTPLGDGGELLLNGDGHPATPFECGVDEETMLPGLKIRSRMHTETTTTRLVARVAIDCDYEFGNVQYAGDFTSASAYAATMAATASVLYDRDVNTQLLVSYFNIWTTSGDPYTYADSTMNGILNEFRTVWSSGSYTSISRDLAFLVSGKKYVHHPGGIAYLDQLCTSFAYAAAIIDGDHDYPQNALPSMDATADVFKYAHEIGHVFGSRHTQSCWWQANGYAPTGSLLDSCVAAEDGSCYSGATGILPPDKGTIMSYCHTLGVYGLFSTLIRLEFHTACKSVIRAGAEACLSGATYQPPGNLVIASNGASGMQLRWNTTTTPSVVRYSVYRSSYPLDPNAGFFASTTDTTLRDYELVPSAYFKVRAVFASDSSDFSNEVGGSICVPAKAEFALDASYMPLSAASADVNGDGILDLVGLCRYTSGTGIAFYVMLGQGSGGVGNGSFSENQITDLGTVYAAPIRGGVVLADLDGDGILDAAVSIASTQIGLFKGDGTGGVGAGTFTEYATLSPGGKPEGLVAGDFNDDGITDLAVAATSNKVVIYLGNGSGGVGDGTFASPTTIDCRKGVYDIVAGDFNEDGITDLAVTCSDTAQVAVLIGQGTSGKGNGSFASPVRYATGTTPRGLAVGDFDEDGIADLAVANEGSGTVSILKGNGSSGVGNGTFASATSYSAGVKPRSIAVADWVENGIADLIVSDVNASAPGLEVLFGGGSSGAGNGTFAAPVFVSAPNYLSPDHPIPVALVAGDFNGDGITDVVSADSVEAGFSTYLNICRDTTLSKTVTVSTPNGSEKWEPASEQTVSWSRGAGVMSVNVDVSRDNGSHWTSVRTNVTDTSFPWTTTLPLSSSAKVRVYDPTAANRVDASNSTFNIVQIRPAPVTDLGIDPFVGKLTLAVSWTAVGDDSLTGRGTEYDLRYSTSAITSSNFSSATRFTIGTPATAGTAQCVVVTGLSACTTYYFAIKTKDDQGNWSAISNVPSAKTECTHNYVAECGGLHSRPDPRADVVLGFSAPQPNPSRRFVSGSVSVPRAWVGSTLGASVYDVSGRRLRSLIQAPAVFGITRWTWDLADASGTHVHAGIYLVRVTLGSESRSFRMLVLR